MEIEQIDSVDVCANAQTNVKRRRRAISFELLAGASILVLASVGGAQAQSVNNAVAPVAQPAQATTADASVEEVVVTARRRAENVQEVPLVVNAVSGQELNKYNIRNLTDITSLVPGLALSTEANGIGSQATLRGVNFDVNASGNNGTVQFYLNDQPITGNVVLQSMYDIGQVEVLRGPQGTLRGRASPSGSITVTTKLPDLEEYGGYLDSTVTDRDGQNVNGAVNIPIIQDKLAIRIAGLYDYNDRDGVRSINDPGVDPHERTGSERATIRFDPTDDIEIVGTVQNFNLHGQWFSPVESANIADPTQPPSPVEIGSFDRKSVQNTAAKNEFDFLSYNVRATWRFAGQKLDYVGAATHEQWFGSDPSDTGDFFNSSFPGSKTAPNDPFLTGFDTTPSVKNYGAFTKNYSKVTTNEVRLSSDDPLWGVVDYVAGVLIDHEGDPFNLWQETPIYLSSPVVAPAVPFLYELSHINQVAHTTEESAYVNVNVHIDDATEISAGGRYISFKSHSALLIQNGSALTGVTGPAAPIGTPNAQDYHPFIYSASLKHNFNDNIMGYVSTGTSWRANAETNPILDSKDQFPWGVVDGLDHLAPETSTSYEAGVKTEWFDKTVLANLTVYHQDFKNFFYSSPAVISVARTGLGPGGSLTGPNVGDTYTPSGFAPAASVDVPAKVNGVEFELGYQPLPNWSINAEGTYSLGKVDNGVIPCNSTATAEYEAGTITAEQFIAANGGQQVATCKFNGRAGLMAPFSAQIQSEYSHKVSDRFDGFIRGLATINGPSENDPLNPIDNITSYTIFNLYGGVRDPDGMWALTLYGKNIFDTQRVTARGANQLATTVQILATGLPEQTGYRAITTTPAPEFGINLHIMLGGG